MDGEKTRKPRLKNADESENKLFIDILKTANDGKMWKIITQGTSKRQECHDVWVAAAKIFSRESGTEITNLATSQIQVASNEAECQEKK